MNVNPISKHGISVFEYTNNEKYTGETDFFGNKEGFGYLMRDNIKYVGKWLKNEFKTGIKFDKKSVYFLHHKTETELITIELNTMPKITLIENGSQSIYYQGFTRNGTQIPHGVGVASYGVEKRIGTFIDGRMVGVFVCMRPLGDQIEYYI